MAANPISPPYIFRIDEIREAPNAPVTHDNRAAWVPSFIRGANLRVKAGVSGQHFYCNGNQIGSIIAEHMPAGMKCYQTYSVFYHVGFGFWVLKGDATNPGPEATWHPLCFEHDLQDGYSSYLCNASESHVLACRRTDQQWLSMLLPDINYDGTPISQYQQYGALKGELAIFLALIAFTMPPAQLAHTLPSMFIGGNWQVYQMPHGREDRRGVVVNVYTWPPTGSPENLDDYENGHYLNQKYYY